MVDNGRVVFACCFWARVCYLLIILMQHSYQQIDQGYGNRNKEQSFLTLPALPALLDFGPVPNRGLQDSENPKHGSTLHFSISKSWPLSTFIHILIRYVSCPTLSTTSQSHPKEFLHHESKPTNLACGLFWRSMDDIAVCRSMWACVASTLPCEKEEYDRTRATTERILNINAANMFL